jgi:multidrug efflux system membrane fusion protein
MTGLLTRRNGAVFVLAAATLLASGWWLLGHRPRHVEPPPRVGVAPAMARDVPETLDVIGTVQPTVSALVRAQLSGTIFAIDAKEGQMVRKGQRLALIDPRPYQLAIAPGRIDARYGSTRRRAY